MNRLITTLSFILLLFPILTYSQSEIWGVTTTGADGFGSLFSMPTGSTGIAFQRNFTGFSGATPQQTKLIQASNGKLYGMTQAGGDFGLGVIYEYDLTPQLLLNAIIFWLPQAHLHEDHSCKPLMANCMG